MTLPERASRDQADPGLHAADLIHHVRHAERAAYDGVVNDIWRHGREHVVQVLFHLAVPVGTYYLETGDVPTPYYLFDVGSADRFVCGHVRAAMDGDEVLATRLLKDFMGSCAEEFERAIRMLAEAASECLNIIGFIEEFTSLTSDL